MNGENSPRSDTMIGEDHSRSEFTSNGARLVLMLKEMSQCRSWPIAAAGMPRMAAANSSEAFGETSDRSVLRHGQHEILTASWVKATLPPDEMAQRELISSRRRNQQQCGKRLNQSEPVHDGIVSGRDSFLAIR